MRNGTIKLFRHINNFEKFLNYYKEGISLSQTAKILGCHHTTLMYWIEKLDLKRDDERSVDELFENYGTKFVKKQLEKREEQDYLSIPKVEKRRVYLFRKAEFPKAKCYQDYLRDSGIKLVKGGMFGYYGKRVITIKV